MNAEQPCIYGYARASDPRLQVLSVDRQEDLITQTAKTLEGMFVRCRSDGASAWRIPWEKRPEFRKLMSELKPGDHLIVWRLDRLDRSPFSMVACLEWLVTRGVNIHVLEYGNMKLDLDTANGRLLVNVLAVFAGYFSDLLSETIRQSLQWCKDNGLAYHGKPAYGKRRVRLKPKAGERRSRAVDVWDEGECAQIREIKRRRDQGESMVSIAQDFKARGLRTANGQPWVKPTKTGRDNVSRLYAVDKWYRRLLAQGKEIGGIPAEGHNLSATQ